MGPLGAVLPLGGRDPPALWLLFVVLLGSAVAGYLFWYGDSLQAAPWYLWLFVPDSPLSVTIMASPCWRFHYGRRWEFLGLVASGACMKYGLWTVLVWFTNYLSGGHYHFTAVLMSATHFGMIVEGLAVSVFLRFRPSPVMVASLFLIVNDVVDYVFDYHPSVPNPEDLTRSPVLLGGDYGGRGGLLDGDVLDLVAADRRPAIPGRRGEHMTVDFRRWKQDRQARPGPAARRRPARGRCAPGDVDALVVGGSGGYGASGGARPAGPAAALLPAVGSRGLRSRGGVSRLRPLSHPDGVEQRGGRLGDRPPPGGDQALRRGDGLGALVGRGLLHSQSRGHRGRSLTCPHRPGADDMVAFARLAEHLLKLPIFYLEYSGMYGSVEVVARGA